MNKKVAVKIRQLKTLPVIFPAVAKCFCVAVRFLRVKDEAAVIRPIDTSIFDKPVREGTDPVYGRLRRTIQLVDPGSETWPSIRHPK